MRRWRHFPILLLTALLPLALSGCMLSASADDLYALPELPAEYETLRVHLAEILSAGAEYAPPQTGGNLPPVQMVDLDGDGVDEVLAFFRVPSEERPLRIYIFQTVDDTYDLVSAIDGSGTSIHSVRYEDMDRDGDREIIVTWSVSAEVQAVSVYALEGLEPVRLMSASYARFEIVDLDGDGDRELVVLRSDETESGATLADYYDWDASKSALTLNSTARLSTPVGALQWMQVGSLREGETAVFVTGRDAGVDETSRAVTDILVYRQPDLTNIVLSSDTGVSSQIYRFVNLQPTDINGDGATEVPKPAELLPDGDTLYWKIYWHSYDAAGADELQAITYHNQADGWYLTIPEDWDGRFAVRQSNITSSVHTTTFYRTVGRNLGDELLTIYTLTGSNRETQANAAGRSILRRRADTVYAVSFAADYDTWRYAITRDELSERFVPIINQWTTNE